MYMYMYMHVKCTGTIGMYMHVGQVHVYTPMMVILCDIPWQSERVTRHAG